MLQSYSINIRWDWFVVTIKHTCKDNFTILNFNVQKHQWECQSNIPYRRVTRNTSKTLGISAKLVFSRHTFTRTDCTVGWAMLENAFVWSSQCMNLPEIWLQSEELFWKIDKRRNSSVKITMKNFRMCELSNIISDLNYTNIVSLGISIKISLLFWTLWYFPTSKTVQ